MFNRRQFFQKTAFMFTGTALLGLTACMDPLDMSKDGVIPRDLENDPDFAEIKKRILDIRQVKKRAFDGTFPSPDEERRKSAAAFARREFRFIQTALTPKALKNHDFRGYFTLMLTDLLFDIGDAGGFEAAGINVNRFRETTQAAAKRDLKIIKGNLMEASFAERPNRHEIFCLLLVAEMVGGLRKIGTSPAVVAGCFREGLRHEKRWNRRENLTVIREKDTVSRGYTVTVNKSPSP